MEYFWASFGVCSPLRHAAHAPLCTPAVAAPLADFPAAWAGRGERTAWSAIGQGQQALSHQDVARGQRLWPAFVEKGKSASSCYLTRVTDNKSLPLARFDFYVPIFCGLISLKMHTFFSSELLCKCSSF